MALKTLVISSYPPDRCGIAKYTVQYAAAQRQAGQHIEVVSTKLSAAHHHANMWTWRGILSVLFLTYRFDRSVVQFFPDLIFRSMYKRQFLPHWPWVALLFGLGRNVEVVIHEAPYTELIAWPGYRGRIMRALWRTLFSLPKRTLVHTDWEREQLVAATGISPTRIEIVPPGATYVRRTRLDRDAARAELGLEPDCFHFLSIGFIQPHKGFDRTVAAFGRLRGERLRLHLVGSLRVADGEVDRYTRDLRALVDATPGAEIREGFITDEEFDRWIVACDAVVLPYRKIVSSAVLERVKLYDRPAVVSDVGGMPHQASETTTVVRDDEELAQAMARLGGAELLAEGPSVRPGGIAPEEVQDRVQTAAAKLRRAHFEGPPRSSSEWEPMPFLSNPVPTGKTRARAVAKRAVARLTAWQIHPVVGAVNDLRDAVIEDHKKLEEARFELVGTKHWLEVNVGELQEAVRDLKAMKNGNGHPSGGEQLAELYAAHQAEFRGSEEDIQERLRVYVPRVREASAAGGGVVDLGSGRGEWLRLLAAEGVEAYGVELNPRLAEHAHQLGSKVVVDDAGAHLRSLPDASLAAVTAFHLVEHLPFEAVVELLDQALRALRPGGVLILETPNPANLAVGAASFWLDPSHLRPWHPSLLRFLLQQRGFADVTVEASHTPAAPIERGAGDPEPLQRAVELLNAQLLVGSDYAAIGRRPPAPDPAPASAPAARRRKR